MSASDRSDLSEEEQKALVKRQLDRHEQIARDTRDRLEARERSGSLDPLHGIEPAVRRAAEDEFYAAQGRQRYETSDGRTLFLTPEQIAERRRSRDERRERRRRAYGASARDPRTSWASLGVYALAAAMALALAWAVLR